MKKSFVLILAASLILAACGSKTPQSQTTPTPIPREYTLLDADKPAISLTPRPDGHELNLHLSAIKPIFSKIEYELIYTASDQGLEVEKGVSGNVEAKDIVGGTFDRKLLLGTESCTSGCKYKYDAGVTGGTLNLTLTTKDNQVASLEMPFKLTSSKKGFTITWQ